MTESSELEQNMAEDFSNWLEERLYGRISETNSHILVAAIVGKETADNTKADLLNNYLGKEVFMDRWTCSGGRSQMECLESAVSIDIYFDSDESVLWLLLNGTNDVAIQDLLFSKELKGLSFFEKMATVERQHVRAMAMLFHLCHVILFVDQGCRFDLDLVSTLKQLNRIRPKICKRVRQTLSTMTEGESQEKFTRTLLDTGRIAAPPRLLFCFYRNPLRSDLGAVKKKELLEKMEKCLENQIANMLKMHSLVDNRYPENALGQITISSGAPFVYCFNNSEMASDQNHELAMALFGPLTAHQGSEDGSFGGGAGRTKDTAEIQHIVDTIGHPKPLDKEKLDPSNYNFHFFLHKALQNLQKGGGTRAKGPELPTIGQFVEAAKLVRQCVGEEFERADNNLKIMPEMNTIESLVDSALRAGESVYTRQLALQPEVTGGGDAVFSDLEHEYTLKMALDYLVQCCPRAAGSQKRDHMATKLRELCQKKWTDGHQRCEQRSITGQLCHFLKNHDSSSGKESRDRSGSGGAHSQIAGQGNKRKGHCSGVKTFSMCNCGLSRQIRVDPFTLKEANFDFYEDTDFSFGSCCAQLDKYQFKLFDPSTASSSDEQQEFARTAPNTQMELQVQTARNSTTQPMREQHFDEEMGAGLAIDPSEFNVRFFDEDSEERPEENISRENPSESPPIAIEGMATQEEGPELEDREEEAEEGLEEEEEEDDESVRKRNMLPDISTDEEEEDEADEPPLQQKRPPISEKEQQPGQSSSAQVSSSASPEPENVHYLDEYDSHLSRGERAEAVVPKRGGREQKQRANDSEMQAKFKGFLLYSHKEKQLSTISGQYLDHVPHSSAPPSLLPLFPSFAVVCLGHSSVYNHSTGIRGAQGNARYRNGSEFLLPWSVELVVPSEQWVRELQFIGVNPSERTMRNMQNGIARGRPESREKVKLFIGFNYECPRGHQFMVGEPGKPLKHRKSSGPLKQDAATLVQTDLPIWMPCPCRKEPRTTAQLMRIHVLTPKAPVSVLLQPCIQMPEEEGKAADGYFFPGAIERIELGWAKYYVCRLPYAYVGPSGEHIYRPSGPEFKGHLLRQCVSVSYLPLSTSADPDD